MTFPLPAAAVVLLAAAAPAAAASSGIQRVAWLRGCWEMSSPERTVEEQWMAPRGGSMVGVGRTVRGSELVEYEMVVIREQGEKLAYEAHPSGQPSATFLSEAVSETSVVFVNQGHDFPKRIGYERAAEDRLLAWIDGGADSERPRIEFAYRRVACGGEARKALRP